MSFFPGACDTLLVSHGTGWKEIIHNYNFSNSAYSVFFLYFILCACVSKTLNEYIKGT